ncbi:hypothetical protein D3C77_471780 [compost metagenome]
MSWREPTVPSAGGSRSALTGIATVTEFGIPVRATSSTSSDGLDKLRVTVTGNRSSERFARSVLSIGMVSGWDTATAFPPSRALLSSCETSFANLASAALITEPSPSRPPFVGITD